MRNKLVGALAVLLAACANAPSAETSPPAAGALVSSSPPSPGAAVSGLLLAERNCSACHAIGVLGQSRVPEAPTFVQLSRRYAGGGLATVISEGIATGHPSMPRWIFRPGEVADLLAYLRTLRNGDQGL
jgi:mono/diheme cytochrome c family protein